MDNNKLWYWFQTLEGIGRKKKDKLLEYAGGVDKVYGMSDRQLKDALFKLKVKDDKVTAILGSRDEKAIIAGMKTAKNMGIRCIGINDDNYPKRLLNIYESPYMLFVKGKLPNENKPVISIVGSRGCSTYGATITRSISNKLSEYGFQIISGMAMGIDKYAHE